MLECAIHRLVGQGEKWCNRLCRTDPTKCLSNRTTHRRLSIFQQTNQANDRLGVAVQSGRVGHHLLKTRRRVAQRPENRLASGCAMNTSQSPNSIQPRSLASLPELPA